MPNEVNIKKLTVFCSERLYNLAIVALSESDWFVLVAQLRSSIV